MEELTIENCEKETQNVWLRLSVYHYHVSLPFILLASHVSVSHVTSCRYRSHKWMLNIARSVDVEVYAVFLFLAMPRQ